MITNWTKTSHATRPTLQIVGNPPNTKTLRGNHAVISGPSGSGKSETLLMLMRIRSDLFLPPVTRYMCRGLRSGENSERVRSVPMKELLGIIDTQDCIVTCSADLGRWLSTQENHLYQSLGIDESDIFNQMEEKPALEEFISAYLIKEVEENSRRAEEEGKFLLWELQHGDDLAFKETFTESLIFPLKASFDTLTRRQKTRQAGSSSYKLMRELESRCAMLEPNVLHNKELLKNPLENETVEQLIKNIRLISWICGAIKEEKSIVYRARS